MMIFISLFGIIFSSASFVMGYSLAGMERVIFWVIALGILWLAAVWGRWRWFSPVGLFVSLFLSIIGLWLGLSIGWMFSGGIFALVAWDVEDFSRKLILLPAREDIKGMKQRHLIRVGIIVILSLLISFGLNSLMIR